jgi:hypothetical protein
MIPPLIATFTDSLVVPTAIWDMSLLLLLTLSSGFIIRAFLFIFHSLSTEY